MCCNRMLLISACLFAVLSPSSAAAQSNSLTAARSAVAAEIKNREPQGVSDTFQSSVNKLYTFSKITGIKEKTNIRHIWYYGDKLMADVILSVSPPTWRTYSSKNILPEWSGKWRVDITSEDGTALDSVKFYIKK